jgi:hypothetical protein
MGRVINVVVNSKKKKYAITTAKTKQSGGSRNYSD